ncbi:hypothetical protein [uncultured Maricaulis sp.]|uniref:DUF4870 family protein n=1 Tax=uncultured Maricaulis sp. TaxID=174710 RepID=UPI0030D96AB7|tara:strand:- start:42851 stop:43234 length:384 start_codon:yes stop_codon:yes gene_type:complete
MSQTILEPETDRTADRDERLMAGLGYVLILLGNIIGVTTLIAVIIAYARKDTAPGWLNTHYVFQIRTFWVAIFGIIASTGLIMTLILSPFGFLGFGLVWLWVLIRSIVGLIRLVDGRGNGDPESYWV